jgi:hypothetical protein
MEEPMLKRVALLAPIALIVVATACGGEPYSTDSDQKGSDQEQVSVSQAELRADGDHGRPGSSHVVSGLHGRRGWVNGRWSPGWGWSRGVWVVGGTSQFECAADTDCIGPLGRDVAVCDFEPSVGLGQCVSPGWF